MSAHPYDRSLTSGIDNDPCVDKAEIDERLWPLVGESFIAIIDDEPQILADPKRTEEWRRKCLSGAIHELADTIRSEHEQG